MAPAGRFEGVVRGAWLWTGERLLPRGGVSIRAGRVEAILAGREHDPPGAPVIDLDRALVHPGLVNAHAHLDLSGLGGAIPEGLPFAGWLARVREAREREGPEGLLLGARRGAAELVSSGVTAVVDFSHAGRSEGPLRESGMRAAVLREVIGPDPARAALAGREAREWLDSREPGGLLVHGLAPHSPYLATPGLIRDCRRWAAGRPFSIHAAEFPGEEEFLSTGGGELRALLESAGVDLSSFTPEEGSPIERLEGMGALDRALLVHAGCLAPEDARRIARRRAAVAFCPRSHRYFGRHPYPLEALLAAGVKVVLGTDSAASNRGLSVAEEMREVHRLFPLLPPEALFAMGTASGTGGVLPWEGLLRPGGPADLAAAELPPGTGEPLAAFLAVSAPNLLTLVEGRVLHGGGKPAAA